MINFRNDYSAGAHPAVLEALCATNMELTPGYGTDKYTRQAEETIDMDGLLALAESGKPYYDAQMAQKVASLKIPCFACSPQMLPQLLERALKGQDLSNFEKMR